MKRYNRRKHDFNNGKLHRAAFNHAVATLRKPGIKTSLHTAAALNAVPHKLFCELEADDGGKYEVELLITQGFRLRIIHLNAHRTKRAVRIPKLHRIAHLRFAQHRKLLIDLQAGSMGVPPLTFRHFNLLLAALSYNPESCPTPTAPPSTTPSES